MTALSSKADPEHTAPRARWRALWARLTLASQFLIAGAVVLLIGMLIIAIWVTQEIEGGVIDNSAAATALYVDSVIAPLFADLDAGGVLPAGATRALDETLAQGALGKRLSVFKIWQADGTIAYASEPALIGQKFALTEPLQKAWSGQVAAEFDHLEDEENASERDEAKGPLLEIYSPIRQAWSGKIIAVAEFYEDADDLEASLLVARTRSWAIVALVTTGMLALLYGIVHQGSATITRQRRSLEDRVGELSLLLAQNEELRTSVQNAASRSVAFNERYLRKVSADLHDGPAQLLALALMRLGKSVKGGDQSADTELLAVRKFLDDCMAEIRAICRGLTLPQIETMALPDVLRSVVASHEERTGDVVAVSLPSGPVALDTASKICLYRFVQEALNNAHRHAGGRGLAVDAVADTGSLSVAVRDGGSGFDVTARQDGLGLIGLRERVESLGGYFGVVSSAEGTVLTCVLPIDGSI